MKNLTLNGRLIHIYNFPDPGSTLDFRLKALEGCIDTGMIVLDANVLLLPLATGALALTEIERVYKILIEQDRLYIPTHALREYLANRPSKIKELIDQLAKKKDAAYSTSASPLLQKANIFDELSAAEKAMLGESKKLSTILKKAIEEIKQWETNDPVSSMYRGLALSKRLIKDPIDFTEEKAIEDFLDENDERSVNKIPPGFKDSRKEENDIGDFLIWKSVLNLGKQNPGKDLTFVSGEIKTDWIYRSAGQALHVREELIEEYREASNGGSFHLIDLATLLRQFKASEVVIAEVRTSEMIATLQSSSAESAVHSNWPDFVEASRDGVRRWLETDCEMKSLSVTDNGYFNCETDGIRYLIAVKPIRHIESIGRRTRELRMRLNEEIKEGNVFSSTQAYKGSIVFVCESEAEAKAANKLLGKQDDDMVIVTGYLSAGNFKHIY